MREILHQPEPLTFQESRSPHQTWRFVVLFSIIGLVLRLINLDLKPAWMDEVSTVIFSLGNSSYFLPTETVVDLDAILRPITSTPDATLLDSARYLLQENNHPPAYFMLAHLWMDWFSGSEIASLWVARSFSVGFSTLSIPLIFWVSKNAFQSSLAGLISTAFMAISPLGVFLAQEARHYGLAIMLITLSLGCFVIATRAVFAHRTPGWPLVLGWIGVNALAFANHYFSALTFTAEGILLIAIAGVQVRQNGLSILGKPHWRSVYAVAGGTFLGILAWLPILFNFYGSPQTTFLRENGSLLKWINPLAQTLAAIIMSLLTPANFFATSALAVGFIVVSILLALGFTVLLVPILVRGGKTLYQHPQGRLGIMLVGGFILTMVTLFLLICYGYGADITRGLRYKFTYYPALIVLVGGIFAVYWPQRSPTGPLSWKIPFTQQRFSGRRIVQATWVVGLLSSLLVVNDFAFPKFYAPDRFIPFVQAHSQHPIVFASTEKIAAQPTVIGAKFLSIAWEIQRHFPPTDPASGWTTAPRFVVLREGYGIEQPITESLADIVAQIPPPFDLWISRSYGEGTDPLVASPPPTCSLAAKAPQGNKAAYNYIHYECGT